MYGSLYVYGLRILKCFVRKFLCRVLMDSLIVNLHQRNDIIKQPSLVHSKLSSHCVVDMFKYVWFKCEYLEEKLATF